MIKTYKVFTSKHFKGEVLVTAVDVDKNELRVEIHRNNDNSHTETWNYEHTILGFNRGDYRYSKEYQFILGRFNQTGHNKIDIEVVKKDWSNLWAIYAYENMEDVTEYRIVKRNSLENENTDLKTSISSIDALRLIKQLGLKKHQSPIFRRSSVYRLEEHAVGLSSL